MSIKLKQLSFGASSDSIENKSGKITFVYIYTEHWSLPKISFERVKSLKTSSECSSGLNFTLIFFKYFHRDILNSNIDL